MSESISVPHLRQSIVPQVIAASLSSPPLTALSIPPSVCQLHCTALLFPEKTQLSGCRDV